LLLAALLAVLGALLSTLALAPSAEASGHLEAELSYPPCCCCCLLHLLLLLVQVQLLLRLLLVAVLEALPGRCCCWYCCCLQLLQVCCCWLLRRYCLPHRLPAAAAELLRLQLLEEV
jgi:hypothetical protein